MRRYAAPSTEAPTTPGDSVRSDTSVRDLLPYFVFAFACYCVAPYLGLSSRDVDPRIAEVWPPGGVGFVLLTVIWFTGRRVVVVTLAAMVLIFAVTAMLMGYHPALSVWLALCRRRPAAADGGDLPQPAGPPELGAREPPRPGGAVLRCGRLLAGARAARRLPHARRRRPVAGAAVVGAAQHRVLLRRRRDLHGDVLRPSVHVLPASSWANRVGLLVTSVLCVYGTYYDPSLPLSWLLIIPSVWGGLTLTVRGTAYLAITVALIAASMTYLPQNQFGYTGCCRPPRSSTCWSSPAPPSRCCWP